ncbi:MAG TPA: 50S ribosomal protein L18 [Thermoanaerobaculia bacterium]|nr:50S ribosomal protein L18 [Thermoanaerobaculia bacterium]HUM30654.1 50S ribosomal protein L18 [Thermoanaerobaculia bacterium]HXK68938.1 50S ribosomal protein L18 [Thermoanaerobaculia bacterium]
MDRIKNKRIARIRIHSRIRTRVSGSEERPRLCVYRSLKNIYAQVIDDTTGKTLLACSTMDPEVKSQVAYGGNVSAAKAVGTVLGGRLKEKGVNAVVFDRGGFRYHGRVKALADAVREAGINF